MPSIFKSRESWAVPNQAFPGQLQDERIFVVSRRHIIAFIPFLFLILVLILLPFVLLGILGATGTFAELTASFWNIIILASSAYLIFVGILFIVGWISYYYDFQIVSDRRLVDIDQHRLFAREINELAFEMIQDVNVSIKGFLATYFDFGDIVIQTAGETHYFTLGKVPMPHRVVKIITDLAEQCRNRIPPEDRMPRGEVIGIINYKAVRRDDHIPALMNFEKNLTLPEEAPSSKIEEPPPIPKPPPTEEETEKPKSPEIQPPPPHKFESESKSKPEPESKPESEPKSKPPKTKPVEGELKEGSEIKLP